MFLTKLCGFIAASFITIAASAQQVKPQILQRLEGKTVTYASAADLAALVDRAKKERKDDNPLVASEFLELAPYTAAIEYRAKGKTLGDVGIHPKFAELAYVLQGSGTLVTGGTIAADRMSIEGGQSQKIGKGDFIFIPENVPHWISQEDDTIVLVTIHMPRPVPAQ